VQPLPETLRPTAERLFGERLELAERFVALLTEQGPERGLIGPREVERLWERHLLNCALMVDGIDALDHPATTLADVGSGAGLPGVVIAIARPELQVTLIETMQRRTTWLQEVDAELGLGIEVVRARAEELHGQRSFEVVTARAVAALDKLARWTLPLVADGGSLLAMKGSSAEGEVEVPTTVVQVRRRAKATRKGDARG